MERKYLPSLTLAFNARAQEMRAQGIDVLNLAAGEPDFPHTRIHQGCGKRGNGSKFYPLYVSCGHTGITQSGRRLFLRHYATEVPPESIIIGAGGKQCLYSFIQATINPGDEVLIPPLLGQLSGHGASCRRCAC